MEREREIGILKIKIYKESIALFPQNALAPNGKYIDIPRKSEERERKIGILKIKIYKESLPLFPQIALPPSGKYIDILRKSEERETRNLERERDWDFEDKNI